jgi:DNA-binding NtrC family response regulator
MLGVSGSEYLLFGEQRTIGTNERRSMKGAFELADGGTVFFDEITNMPMDIQGMLLRVLQEKETTRLGTLQPIQVNFRVVSSTRHDLEALVREKKFSQELYQRLNVIPIYLKPLKDHLEDVPSLVSYFVQKLPRPFTEIKFTPNAFQVLASYPWPGNVRELSNLVGYISTLADITREIDVSELPPQIRQYEKQLFGRPRQSAQDHESRIKNSKSVNFYESVARFEKDILKAEFEKAKGNISRMAMNIGIDRSYLYTKLREHKLYDNKKSSES